MVGIALGLLAAWRRGSALDVAALTFSLFTWSLPTFFLGIILLFAGRANGSTCRSPGARPSAPSTARSWDQWLDRGRHLLMPTLTFTLVLLGEYMLIMRSSVIDVFSEDYILTAKAKGLSTFRIIT